MVIKKMIGIFINGRAYSMKEGITIIQSCKEVGIDIPRFCYHEKLSIAGNCRMCLIEVEKSIKPVASCALPIMIGMKVKTNTLYVKRAREGVMEFLLLNHPLDCPICDQGGECDLQDQAMVFGNDRGRYYEIKRAVEDKNINPFIKTIMTRCIHCTRCIRFFVEIAGKKDLGITGRGNKMEIGTYVNNLLESEISGNVIDLCPVGALTGKPNAFKVRSWELKTIQSIDVYDSFGGNIGIQVRGDNIFRVIPLLNNNLNEEWITDRVRFAYDGLKKQRIWRPMFRKEQELVPMLWKDIFSVFIRKCFSDSWKMQVILGSMVELETIQTLYNFFAKFNLIHIKSLGLLKKCNDFRFNYMLNTCIKNIELATVVVIFGINLRMELPLLGIRLRKIIRKKDISFFSIGVTENMYVLLRKVSNTQGSIYKFLEGKSWISVNLKRERKPLIFVGEDQIGLELNVFDKLIKYTNVVTKEWIGLNYITVRASEVGYQDYNFNSLRRTKEKLIKNPKELYYLLDVDEIEKLNDKYIIYHGHHGDIGANFAHIIFPGSVFAEKEGMYMNIEGRLQKSRFVNKSNVDNRVDWQFFQGFDAFMFEKQKIIGLDLYMLRAELFQRIQLKIGQYCQNVIYVNEKGKLNKVGYIGVLCNRYGINFFLLDNVTRASKVMGLAYRKYELNYFNYIQ
jgi:NADH-quinone oxidoreductase chain G